MKIFADTRPGSFVARLDPRVRVGAAFAISFLVVLLKRWSTLSAALAAGCAMAIAAGAVNRWMLRRLAGLNLFTLFLLISMPLSVQGEPAWRIGGLTWSGAGFMAALRIGLKANAVMVLFGAMLAGMEPADLAHALEQLGMPRLLTQSMFFCIRYLEIVHGEYHRMVNAMKLRAFRPACTRHSLRSLGYLVGMLFVRSLDRSERVNAAMKCRGFDGRLYSLARFKPGMADSVFAASAGLFALWLAMMEWQW